ncbi:gluconokinase [Croceitalea marina]|uniref:Gluconokinase n=1 Tax=Croceitalea marina TaxID=1775166 RepID=A0ABW5MTZ5_9FLAO
MRKTIFFVMGVSGTGKTTIGKLLAKENHMPFFDGDDYHPKENIKKMASGNALNDDDRFDWLAELNKLAIENKTHGAVIACSALKKNYRVRLKDKIEEKAIFIHLEGAYEDIKKRLDNRENHYMTSALLKSQFEILEPPTEAITISILNTPKEIILKILSQLKND